MSSLFVGVRRVRLSRGGFERGVMAVFERALGWRYHLSPRHAHGHDDCADLARMGIRPAMIFDVGANAGQTASKYRSAFPDARILSFEPVAATYARLRANTTDDRIETYRLAFGATAGQETIYLTAYSTTSSLIEPANWIGREQVEVSTLDRFADDHGIARIDLLKIDVEGAEMAVLEGAANLLASGRIGLVSAEVGFNPSNGKHCLFEPVRHHLHLHGFEVLGIYDQTMEHTGLNRLRFANVSFVHRDVVQAVKDRRGH